MKFTKLNTKYRILITFLFFSTFAFAEVSLDWTQTWGNNNYESDKARSVCVDSSGNAFVAGEILGNYGSITNPGNTSSMLTKLNPAGEILWAKLFGATSRDYSYNITLDSSENIYIVGRTSGGFNDQSSIGDSDAYLIKFNSEGSTIWTRVFGSTDFDSANSVCCDDSGNIFVAGYTKDEFAGQTNVNVGKYDAFLSKFNSSGSNLWTRIFGSDNYDYSKGVCCDTNGNLFVSGYTQGEFGGELNTFLGKADMFLVKFNYTGSTIWTRIWGSVENDYSGNVKCDKNGNLLVSGHTYGSFNGELNSGKYDLCLTKFNNSGSVLWTRIFGSNLDQKDSCVDVDSVGNVFVSGSSEGGFDGQTNCFNGMQNHCAKKFDPNGVALWTRCWGPLAFVNLPYGVAYDKNGNLFTAGYTYIEDEDTSLYLSKLCLLPEIKETALIFPATNSAVLHAPALTNITWQFSGITDDAGGTDLTISKISVLNVETTNEVAIITNNIQNSVGEIPWLVPESLISSDNYYVLKFEVADSIPLTTNRIFWNNKFKVGMPEINLKGKLGIDILNGDSSPNLADDTDFGEAVFDYETVTNSFEIENTGKINLNISDLNFSLSCPEFSIVKMPEPIIAPGTSTIFKITFAPTNEGTFFAIVNIKNDDNDEGTYTFAIKGEGVPEPCLFIIYYLLIIIYYRRKLISF